MLTQSGRGFKKQQLLLHFTLMPFKSRNIINAMTSIVSTKRYERGKYELGNHNSIGKKNGSCGTPTDLERFKSA